MASKERERLLRDGPAWKSWGPYLADRAWGTVREDVSAHGDAWKSFPHEHARSRAYRWGEDGIGGFCDKDQLLCFALGMWNGRDPILKERFFGLDNAEGNHGEDCKELYYYTDAVPTHSYMRMLYKYPQRAFPYAELVRENGARGKDASEYELLDTGLLEGSAYFDVQLEYAKAEPEDICVLIRVQNAAAQPAVLHLLPTLWFRNTWSWGPDREVGHGQRPRLYAKNERVVRAEHELLGPWELRCCDGPDGQSPQLLFCENETNRDLLWSRPNSSPYVKDGVNEFLVQGIDDTVNPAQEGTKVSVHYGLSLDAGAEAVFRLRLYRVGQAGGGLGQVADVVQLRREQADEFYADIHPSGIGDELKMIQRQAWAGMLWSKQWFAYDVPAWSRQVREDGEPRPYAWRNRAWHHVSIEAIMSMPDTWEYPWFAAWDLAFQSIPLAYVDSEFAKEQLLLLLSNEMQAANGAVPAYEWNFDDCNPPVIARAVWRVYHIDRAQRGQGDRRFLSTAFHKLSSYYVWWLNRKDASGNHLFQGGFLGLDNIGVFDRSKPLPTGGYLEQSDGTAWMGVFCLDMALIGLELSDGEDAVGDLVNRYAFHYLYLAVSMNNFSDTTGEGVGLWDDEDEFFYDVLRIDAHAVPLRVRSMVGLIPLFASIAFPVRAFERLRVRQNLQQFVATRPVMAQAFDELVNAPRTGIGLASLVPHDKVKALLRRMLDENEFLSAYGLRALSKFHEQQPYVFYVGDVPFRVSYVPGDSDSDLFGGNSNWRGPIWFPLNYMIITALKCWHLHLGEQFKVEFPTGSGNELSLGEIADELARRLISLFEADREGRRPACGEDRVYWQDPRFAGLLQFYEYFHGDSGRGLGASHQTGWTGLVAVLIQELEEAPAVPLPSTRS